MIKRKLFIDLETYSSIDLVKCGLHKYVEAKDFKILLFAYAFEDEQVTVVDFANGENLPKEVYEALTDEKTIKIAFNAAFERNCLERYFYIDLPVNQWRCTAIKCAYMGLPLSLQEAAKCLKLDVQKIKEGKDLIKYFSMPCKETKYNDHRKRNLPEDNMEKWQSFKEYCARDVIVEMAIDKKLNMFTIPEKELQLWFLDQKINSNGIKIHKNLVENAMQFNSTHEETLKNQFIEITNIKNPRSIAQLKKWLNDYANIKIDNLTKEGTADLINSLKVDGVNSSYIDVNFHSNGAMGINEGINVKKSTITHQQKLDKIITVLNIQKQLSKTSIKKYEAMERSMCNDNRIRGLLQFYGANRTGRWAGRLVQIHNLPQNKMENLQLARTIVDSGDYELLNMLYDNVPDVLSQLIRTAFIPEENHIFIICDFNAIEARITAWLAKEKWRIELFKNNGKLYETSAARMFKVPVESITKESKLRQSGKIAELALGYQGGKGALTAMGALKMGIVEDELTNIVSSWRNSNANIVKLWSTVEKAAIEAVKNKTLVEIQYGIKFIYDSGVLFIKLPSGRNLSYIRPTVEYDFNYNRHTLKYEGMDQTTKQWGKMHTYGGKLVENIVQAIARDCLAESLIRLDKHNYKIVCHIHDEAVLEVPNGHGSLKEVEEIMGETITWAKGLVLKAEGFEAEYYRK